MRAAFVHRACENDPEIGPEVLRLLLAHEKGARVLVARVYPELRRIAAHYMRQERPGR